MSGFIVIYNKNKAPVNENLLRSLTETLKMRGPDGQTLHIDRHVGMGHALFKTTFEAEYEDQPATLDGKVWIVCSARVDDREHLVNKLGMKKKINLNRTPDSELILHAYRKWGESCLEHLLGDFAFVIWDSREKKLFCGTDIFAKKQLYYAETKNSFLVSNNIYTLLKHPEVSKEISDKAMVSFLLYGGYHWVDKTLTSFEDILVLTPAHSLVFSHKKISIEKYWLPPTGYPVLHYKKDQEYIDHFMEVFSTAVEDRIRTGKVTVALSGGMDSTSIAAILSQLQKEHHSNFDIQLITEMKKRKNYESSEYLFAKEVADFLSLPLAKWNNSGGLLKMDFATIHPITVLTPDTLPDTAKMYYGHGRVIFTGNGSDELFATTPLSQYLGKEPLLDIIKGAYQHRKRHNRRPPLGIRGSLKKYLGQENRPPLPNIVKLLNSDIKKKLDIENLVNKIYKEESVSVKQKHFAAAQRLIKPKWNIEGAFLDADFPLAEYRDPFLDRRVIEFVFSLPELGWTFDKYLLRRAMKEKLPESIITRTKQTVYGYQDAILQEEENQWIHQWKPSGILKPYIDTYTVNNTSLFEKQEYAFHNLRLIMLENWLKILKSSN